MRKKLRLGKETIRTLRSWQLTAANGGVPAVTQGDVECPATMTAPTCDGGSCVATECTNCDPQSYRNICIPNTNTACPIPRCDA